MSEATTTCPRCGTQQTSTRLWCTRCFASFVPEPELPPAPDPDEAAAAEIAPEAGALAAPAVRLAISDVWAAQAPSRMPQIISVAVVLCALALILLVLMMRPT